MLLGLKTTINPPHTASPSDTEPMASPPSSVPLLFSKSYCASFSVSKLFIYTEIRGKNLWCKWRWVRPVVTIGTDGGATVYSDEQQWEGIIEYNGKNSATRLYTRIIVIHHIYWLLSIWYRADFMCGRLGVRFRIELNQWVIKLLTNNKLLVLKEYLIQYLNNDLCYFREVGRG